MSLTKWMVNELTALNRTMMLSIDVIPVPTDEAVREMQSRLLGVALVGNRTKYIPLYVEDAKSTGNLQELYYGSIVQSRADENLIPPSNLENLVVQKVLSLYDHLQTPFYGEYSDGWASFFNTAPMFFQWFVGLIIIIGVVPVFHWTMTGRFTRQGKNAL